MPKSQKENILEYLQIGNKITPLEALYKFGSFRLSAIIFELRKGGSISLRTIKLWDGKTFAEYELVRVKTMVKYDNSKTFSNLKCKEKLISRKMRFIYSWKRN